jgi:hypothetical protein
MRVPTPHFAFYFHAQDERVIKQLIDEAEEFRKKVVGDVGVDFTEATDVYLAPSLEEYQKLQPRGKVPAWSVGVAYPASNLIVMRSPRTARRGSIDLRKVFIHELSHMALGKAFRGRERVPRWLDEGVALYESKQWDFSRMSTMTVAVLTDSLIPLFEITHSFPREAEKAKLAYAQSFYLVSFLVSQYGRERFHGFIKDYSGGKGLDPVLMEVYGIGLYELEEKWRDYLKLRFSWIPIATSTTTLWFLAAIALILGYLKKRRAARLKLEQWEREEEGYTLH